MAIYFSSSRFDSGPLICGLFCALGPKSTCAVCACVLELEWCQVTELRQLVQEQNKEVIPGNAHENPVDGFLRLSSWLARSYSFSRHNISLNACRQLTCLSIVSPPAWTCPLRPGLPYFQIFYRFSRFPLNSLQFVFLFKHVISKTEYTSRRLRWNNSKP